MGLGFTVLLALMVALVVVGLNALETINTELVMIVNVENVRTGLANEMIDDARETAITVRGLLLAKYKNESRESIQKVREELAEHRRCYNDDILKLKKLISKDNTKELDSLNKVDASGDAARQLQDRVVELAVAGKHRAGHDLMVKEAYPFVKRWIKEIDDLIHYENERTLLRFGEIQKQYAAARTNMFILGAAAVALSVLIVVFLTLSITRPLGSAVQAASRIASGDLTVDLSTDGKRGDELGVLIQALSKMIENSREQIRGIRDGVTVLVSSASEISATVSQVTSGAQESSAAVVETMSTMEEVKLTVNATSQKTREIADKAQQGLQAAHEGRQASEKLAAGMQNIREQMGLVADTIMKLSEQSQTIGEITDTVEDLADRSDLLAVNAAVEAARAGELGKGFAVVAQEIKGLAEQSKQATKQVRGILAAIQKSTGTAVMATERGGKVVDQGVKEATGASESIQALNRHVAESIQSVGQIAAAGKEQLTAIDQVTSAMENIKEAAQQNAAGMKQLEAAVQGLNEMGKNISSLVARYKV